MHLKKIIDFLKSWFKKHDINNLTTDKKIIVDEKEAISDDNVKEALDEEKNKCHDKIKFEDIKPRMVIIAKTPDYNNPDLTHLTRPFIVVGKSSKGLYAIKETTSSKCKGDNRYYVHYNYKRDIASYCKCNKIYEITKDEFKYFSYHMPYNEYKKLIEKLTKYCKELNKIDWSLFSYRLTEGSILLKENDLYIVLKKENDQKYKIAKLIIDNESKIYDYFMGQKHVIDTDNIITIDNNNSYEVIGYVDPKISRLNWIDVSDYKLGDVLSLKGSNQKIIYLTQIGDRIFYLDLDSLEFYTGIGKINKEKISGFYRKLNEDEMKALVKKVEKPLNNDNLIYYGAKENILNSVKKLKNNYCERR